MPGPTEPKPAVKTLEGKQTVVALAATLFVAIFGFFFAKGADGNPMVSFDQLLKLIGIAWGGGTIFTMARHWLKGKLGVANGVGSPHMGDNLLLSKLKKKSPEELRKIFEKLLPQD